MVAEILLGTRAGTEQIPSRVNRLGDSDTRRKYEELCIRAYCLHNEGALRIVRKIETVAEAVGEFAILEECCKQSEIIVDKPSESL